MPALWSQNNFGICVHQWFAKNHEKIYLAGKRLSLLEQITMMTVAALMHRAVILNEVNYYIGTLSFLLKAELVLRKSQLLIIHVLNQFFIYCWENTYWKHVYKNLYIYMHIIVTILLIYLWFQFYIDINKDIHIIYFNHFFIEIHSNKASINMYTGEFIWHKYGLRHFSSTTLYLLFFIFQRLTLG